MGSIFGFFGCAGVSGPVGPGFRSYLAHIVKSNVIVDTQNIILRPPRTLGNGGLD